jgi:hypothetical protein
VPFPWPRYIQKGKAILLSALATLWISLLSSFAELHFTAVGFTSSFLRVSSGGFLLSNCYAIPALKKNSSYFILLKKKLAEYLYSAGQDFPDPAPGTRKIFLSGGLEVIYRAVAARLNREIQLDLQIWRGVRLRLTGSPKVEPLYERSYMSYVLM